MSHKNEIVPNDRDKAYLGQVWVGKKRFRRVLISYIDAKNLSPKELEVLLTERLKQLKTKLKKETERLTESDGLLFSELSQLFLKHIEANRDRRTYLQYQRQLNRFQKLVGDYRIQLHNSTLTDRFVLSLRKQKLSDHTINSNLRAVSGFLNWCWANHHLKYEVRVTKLRTSKRIPKYFSDQQLQKLLEYLTERYLQTKKRRYLLLIRAWYLLRFTAIRGGELLNLKWCNVYPDRIELRSSTEWKVKGRKDVTIRINPVLAEFISQQDSKNEVYVLDDGSGKLNYGKVHALTQSMKKAQLACDIKGYKPLHSFRTTVATELSNMPDTNIAHVQDLLRHKSITTTMSYVRVKDIEQQNLVNKIGGKGFILNDSTGGNTGGKQNLKPLNPSKNKAYNKKPNLD